MGASIDSDFNVVVIIQITCSENGWLSSYRLVSLKRFGPQNLSDITMRYFSLKVDDNTAHG
jgi:hypothetical protein